MRKLILAPSILAADACELGHSVRLAEEAGCSWLHIDVMDGAFVPSLSFGLPVVQSLKKHTDLYLDVHLMIEEPERYIHAFAEAGADGITVHAEATYHLNRVIGMIHDQGKKAGVALNPATSLNALDYALPDLDMVLLMTVNPGYGGQAYIPMMTQKIRALRGYCDHAGFDIDIEVDGGITQDNVSEVIEAGANVFVAGTSVFRGDIAENVQEFLQIFQGYEMLDL